MTRPPLLSLSIKAGLILFAVVAGALAIVYVAVAPQLESRLVDAKTEELERAVPTAVRTFEAAPNRLNYQERAIALDQTFDARVIVLTRIADSLAVVADSGFPSDEDVRQDRVALAAAERDGRASGRVGRADREFAEVAAPLGGDEIVLLSAPLDDTLANVDLVTRTLAIAGGVALLVSWFGGYLVAAWLAGIIVNLLVLGDFYDVALRDFGLLISAIALARLATAFHGRSALVEPLSPR